MHPIDWAIVIAYLAWILIDGVRRAKGTHAIEGYFLASRSLPWWAVGLSVMATQMSAITLVGTTGQGYADGVRFVQFYFGLPVAMIILSVTLVPFFHRARVFTAYEYLEQRFDAKTRFLASLLFLVSRGLSAGVIIAAPAVILSIVLGWSLPLTILAIGIPTTVYTMFGGVQAVTWADVKQMVVILVGVTAAVVALIAGLPDDVSVEPALHVAGATGRLQTIDFTFDLSETYTFWSGMLGGLFLMLGYFGCDQSQVQRYLTARSVNAGRRSLLMSAFAKIPLQMLILVTGVLVFVFYLFNEPPMLFNPVHQERVEQSGRAADYAALDGQFHDAFEARRVAAAEVVTARRAADPVGVAAATGAFVERDRQLNDVRSRAETLIRDVTGDQAYTDVNYVFPTFVTSELPGGSGRSHDCRDLRGRDVEHRGRVELAVDRHGDRFLSTPRPEGGVRQSLSERVQAFHVVLGGLCVGHRPLRRKSRVAHRGGQPLWVLLLRLPAGDLHPRRRGQASHGHRGVLGSGRGDGHGGGGCEHDHYLFPLVQLGRGRRSVRHRHPGQPRILLTCWN